jgi:hypothetical protein
VNEVVPEHSGPLVQAGITAAVDEVDEHHMSHATACRLSGIGRSRRRGAGGRRCHGADRAGDRASVAAPWRRNIVKDGTHDRFCGSIMYR